MTLFLSSMHSNTRRIINCHDLSSYQGNILRNRLADQPHAMPTSTFHSSETQCYEVITHLCFKVFFR